MNNYIDTIKKYISGKQYANTNVQSADGTIAYMTSTGVSKVYPSHDAYKSTIGKNNCKSDFIQLTPNWNDLGFPIGTLMKSGQSCGNENTYVQSEPPQTNFDWKYYLQNNPDLASAGITTEQQATNHWNNHGKQEGRIPNATIMNSMSTLGKIGYIDVDTQIHRVPPTYTKTYADYLARSNVTGVKMEDCTMPLPSIKYGEPIVLTQYNKFGSINSSSLLEIGSSKTNLFLRPPAGSSDMQGIAVKYGDYVSISSSSSSYTSECGWWGCKVSRVNPTTNKLEFGPGGESATTFQLIPPKGTVYEIGTELKYGFPFSFMSTSSTNKSKLKSGSSVTCASGNSDKTVSGGIYRYTGNNTLQLYPEQTTSSSWNPNWATNPTSIDCSTYTIGDPLKKFNAANLANGKAVTCASGQELPNGVNGGVYRYVDDNILRWYPSATVASSWDRKWSKQRKQIDCSTYIAGDPITMKMDASSDNSVVQDAPKIAFVVKNIISFGSWSESKGSNTFSFQSNYKPSTNCNVEELQGKCNDSSECIGFIHAPSTNTWQMITPTSSSTDYKITTTLQDFHLKNATVNLKDASCDDAKVSFIDPTLFSNYPTGTEFVKEGVNQCNVINPPEVPTQYTKDGKKMIKHAKKMADKINPANMASLYKQNNKIRMDTKNKTDEYSAVLNKIQQTTASETLDQQQTDMLLFDDSNQSAAIMWGIFATTILAIIIFRPRS